jgi:hypothetical protein
MLKVDFQRAEQGYQGIGQNNKEIIISPRDIDAPKQGRIVRSLLSEAETRSVIITDNHDLSLIKNSLGQTSDEFKASTLKRLFQLRFNNVADMSSSFEKVFNAAASERGLTSNVMDEKGLKALKSDVLRSAMLASPLFIYGDFGVNLICFDKDKELMWHIDTKSDDYSLVVRPLSDEGTYIAFKDDTKETDEPGHKVDRCVHAGQGLYFIKGNTVHSSPNTGKERWVYLIAP